MEEHKGYLEKCNKAIELQNLGNHKNPKIWFPSIEELIKLCKKLPDYTSDWRLHTKMRMSMQKDYCSCYTKNLSIKEMWLLFYMKYAFNKKWNEARKEWM